MSSFLYQENVAIILDFSLYLSHYTKANAFAQCATQEGGANMGL